MQGRPSPLRPWCIFSPISDFPYFLKIFGLWGQFSQFYLFPKNFLIFIRWNFWWPFFKSSTTNFEFPPYFPCFSIFPTLFRKNYYSPYFDKFPPVLDKFICFLHTLRVFRVPLLWPWCIYASPNARTGRPCKEGSLSLDDSQMFLWFRAEEAICN